MTSADRETILQNVRRHAEEIRVRIHLGSMEARDAWAELEPKVKKLEHMFARATADAGKDMNELAETLQRELAKLRQRVFDTPADGGAGS